MRTAFLKQLSERFGAPTREEDVRALIEAELKKSGISCTVDRFGNLFAHVSTIENAPRVAVFCHMDEAGVMLTEICEDGFLRFDTLGDIDIRVLCGRLVTLRGIHGDVKGLIAAKGIHLQSKEERSKLPEIEDLYLDIGAREKKQAEMLVSLGDTGVFDRTFSTFGKDLSYFMGKALDDRVGCAILTALAERLASVPLGISLTLAFLTRTEAVPAGVGVALAAQKPDLVISVDAFPAHDVGEKCRGTALGSGAVLPFSDKHTLFDRRLHALAREAANAVGATYQIPATVEEGDAADLYRVRDGVRALAVGFPLRNMKSPTSVGAFSDLSATEAILAELLLRLSKENI